DIGKVSYCAFRLNKTQKIEWCAPKWRQTTGSVPNPKIRTNFVHSLDSSAEPNGPRSILPSAKLLRKLAAIDWDAYFGQRKLIKRKSSNMTRKRFLMFQARRSLDTTRFESADRRKRSERGRWRGRCVQRAG